MLYASGFVDDVMFSHNEQSQRRRVCFVAFASPGGGTGRNVYRLRLLLLEQVLLQ